jgi:chromatin segregation and condensation protein Rec8/ScpA/Scc1 (kleisin family)
MEKAREELKAKEPRFVNKAHEEDDEQEITKVWEKIKNLGTGPLNIRDLYVNDVKANITTFVSVLHLAMEGKLAIWQDNMPYGDIYVEEKMVWKDGIVEDAEAAAELVKRAVV